MNETNIRKLLKSKNRDLRKDVYYKVAKTRAQFKNTLATILSKVNGEKKFFARPGTIKDNVCVKITEVYDEMHELLRNYF